MNYPEGFLAKTVALFSNPAESNELVHTSIDDRFRESQVLRKLREIKDSIGASRELRQKLQKEKFRFWRTFELSIRACFVAEFNKWITQI